MSEPKKKRVTVRVTREHIDAAIAAKALPVRVSENCPLARAFSDATGMECSVGAFYWHAGGLKGKLPPRALETRIRFDHSEYSQLGPFSFRITLPVAD